MQPFHVGLKERGYDVGPETVQLFENVCNRARTIFFNGTLGKYETKPFDEATHALLRTLSQTSAHTIVAGGDTTSALQATGCDRYMSFVSTGGGAALAFIAHHDPFHELPGLQFLHISL